MIHEGKPCSKCGCTQRYNSGQCVQCKRMSVATRQVKKLGIAVDVTSENWVKLLHEYDDKCLCCGTTEDITMDHVVPLSRGGLHVLGNLQPLCLSCNCTKGTNNVDYRQFVPEWVIAYKGEALPIKTKTIEDKKKKPKIEWFKCVINLDAEDRHNCEEIRVKYKLSSMADAIRYALKLVSMPNAFLVLREGGPEYHIN